MKIVIPYRPRYPEIHRIIDKTRFTVLVAHRRFGKTVLAVNHLIKTALLCVKPAGHFVYIDPFLKQVRKVAWPYLKHYTAGIKGREINETYLTVKIPSRSGYSELCLFGADNPDGLRGTYYDGVILDEVAQMKPDVWQESIRPALSDRLGYAVFIGTPKGVNLFSDIYHKACERQAKGQGWAALLYPCTKTNAITPEELAAMKDELSDNTFRQELMCDFNAATDDTLIDIEAVRNALGRKIDPALAMQWPLVIGCDIARFGDDATVFYPRRGAFAYAPFIYKKKSNTDIAHLLLKAIADYKPAYVNIDQGQGTGVIDMVRDAAQGMSVIINEVPFGSKALEDARFVNRRAEMWKNMSEWIQGACIEGGAHTEMLLGDLAAPRYSYDTNGKIKLESKDEIKRRLARSTDLGDALALTFAVPVLPKAAPALPRKKQGVFLR